MNNTKIKLRGHESFYIREGWLRKGTKAVSIQNDILSDNRVAVDELGIGSAMVKSLRYWLQATGVTEELRGEKGKRIQKLTDGFGDIIFENDQYFQDLGTIYLLHYKLVSNKNLATTWYLFFNKLRASEMTKIAMFERLKQEILNINPSYEVSEKSLMDDCNCMIKTYYADKNDFKNPEDNMISPFSDLGLIKKAINKNKEEIIVKTIPNRKKLDRLIVLYVIVDNMYENKTTTIEALIEDESNIGKVFNLDKNTVNNYVDTLENEGYITVNRTAGLNTIYLTETADEILNKYYSEN